MTYKIIQTENYLLVVDDSEIKKGDYTFQEASNLISKYNNAYSKKIIAHLPLNNSPILEGVDLLPQIEDEVSDCEFEFQNGYKKAKEKYKYTEDDIMKAIKMAQEESWDEGGYLGLEHEPNKIIQSIKQPKIPIAFECEVQTTKGRYIGKTKIGVTPAGETITINEGYEEVIKPKTTTNSQGLTQWVGKYIFE